MKSTVPRKTCPMDIEQKLQVSYRGAPRIFLKEITHLRHFSKTLLIIFTIQFFILFSETLIISQTKSWASQNNIKYKSKFKVNRTQRYGASQSHSSCCELIGHRRATDEVVPAAGLRII